MRHSLPGPRIHVCWFSARRIPGAASAAGPRRHGHRTVSQCRYLPTAGSSSIAIDAKQHVRYPPFGAGFRQIVGRVRAARERSFCARRTSCSPLGRGSGVVPADRAEMPAQPVSMTRCHVFSESWSLDAWSASSQTCRDPTSPAGMTSGQAESAASGAPEPGNERRRGLACPTTRRRRQGGGLP